MTTPNDNTPTPRTDEVWNGFQSCDQTDTRRLGVWIGSLCVLSRQLERELAEAKSKLEATERARAFAMENSANLISAALERDAARADAQRWRECAELSESVRLAALHHLGQFIKFTDCDLPECSNIFKAHRILANKSPDDCCESPCQSPTSSSPPSPSPEPSYLEVCVMCGAKITSWIGNKAICGNCKMTAEPAQSIVPPWTGAKPTAEELQAILDGPQLADSVHAESAPETETASRLAEHESRLELLLRRTEFLLEQLSQALLDNGEFRIAWPADLALTESTSTSQPTPKPSGSGDASCG